MESTATPPRLISAKEVARILGTTPTRVRELVREGRRRSIRLTDEGYHRFDPRELERFLSGGKPDE